MLIISALEYSRAIASNQSADTAHLIASPKSHNNIRCTVSADLEMVARNRSLKIFKMEISI